MLEPIKYLENPLILEKIMQGPVYRKKELTDLRLISEDEEKKLHRSYVLDKRTNTIQIETTNTLTRDLVVARNQQAIGKDAEDKPIYNEWLIPIETVKENYGAHVYQNLTNKFVAYPKKASLRAIEITSEIFALFNSCNAVDEEGGIHLMVPWGTGKMIARQGDFLTDAGYAIAAKNFEAYEIIHQGIKETYSVSMDNHFFKSSHQIAEPRTEAPIMTMDVKDNVADIPIQLQDTINSVSDS